MIFSRAGRDKQGARGRRWRLLPREARLEREKREEKKYSLVDLKERVANDSPKMSYNLVGGNDIGKRGRGLGVRRHPRNKNRRTNTRIQETGGPAVQTTRVAGRDFGSGKKITTLWWGGGGVMDGQASCWDSSGGDSKYKRELQEVRPGHISLGEKGQRRCQADERDRRGDGDMAPGSTLEGKQTTCQFFLQSRRVTGGGGVQRTRRVRGECENVAWSTTRSG